MDSKFVAITVLAVVAFALATSSIVVYVTDEEECPTYAILDDPVDSVRKGLTIMEKTDGARNTVHVTGVSGDVVSYTFHQEFRGEDETDVDDFDIDTYVKFDYTDPAQVPQGITVVHSVSGEYALNGTGIVQDSSKTYKMAFDNLKFTIIPGILFEISGKVVLETDYGTEQEKISSTLHSADGKVKETNYCYDRVFTDEVSKEIFIAVFFETYNASSFNGCTVTPCDAERVNGKKCDVVRIDGVTTGSMRHYEDFKVYTYNSYIVKASGIIDDEKVTAAYSYFYE